MKILLLIPRHFRSYQERELQTLDTASNLPIYQVQNFWYQALVSLGHSVQTFIYTNDQPHFEYISILGKRVIDRLTKSTISLPFPVWQKQKMLLKLAHVFRPHLTIFSGNTDSIFFETLVSLKQLSRQLVLFNGLSPVVFATKTEKQAAHLFDYVFTNDRYHALDWLMLGAPHAASLPVSAIDPETYHKYTLTRKEVSELSADIAFVGALSPALLYSDRIKYLEAICDLPLKTWTPHKELILSNKKLKQSYAGEASGIKMCKIFSASKINLNFHGHTMQAGGNLRTFEIPGCSGFQILDRTETAWFKPNKEVVTFTTVQDLRKKIIHYLKYSKVRNTITQAGFRRAHRDHTFNKRFLKMFKLLQYV